MQSGRLTVAQQIKRWEKNLPPEERKHLDPEHQGRDDQQAEINRNEPRSRNTSVNDVAFPQPSPTSKESRVIRRQSSRDPQKQAIRERESQQTEEEIKLQEEKLRETSFNVQTWQDFVGSADIETCLSQRFLV